MKKVADILYYCVLPEKKTSLFAFIETGKQEVPISSNTNFGTIGN
jgi:hypothetical protein